MIQQINQGSGNDILYVEKTLIFSAHSAVTCSKDCPWDKSCDMHRVPDRHTDAHHMLTHTTDSFTVKDKWCLTLWPGEMGWLNRSEMKILLTKVPWAKQVVSLGNCDADFCSSRATCQSTHAPNNHTESWQTLSASHKLMDWQLNGRKCLGLLWVLYKQSNRNLSIIMTSGWSYYYTSDTLLILNCLSQFSPLCVDKEWREFRTLQRTFKVMSVFCTERQKQLQLRGFIVLWEPQKWTGREDSAHRSETHLR